MFLIGTMQLLNAQEHAWIYFTDKENVENLIANPISILTQKAIDRKKRHNIVIDERDVPVNQNYINQLKNNSALSIKAKSKWFNTVHVVGTIDAIEALRSLNFVSHIEFANRSLNRSKPKIKKVSKFETKALTFDYGLTAIQTEMIGADDLHRENYTGNGITIAIMDAGFPNVNTMSSFLRLRNQEKLLHGYNFVNRNTNVYASTTSSHGTWVLSNMAGFIENRFVGTAADASYHLFITEDALSETPAEESYWVEAAERADSLGVDIINTSLGYFDFDGDSYDYVQSNMDGKTAYITKGANIAFEKGMFLVTSAGNSGDLGITAPADAPNTLTVGAVDASKNYAAFSSVGTIYQNFQKPDVVAQGQTSYIITESDNIATANGTSFSSPIMAGGVACLWQALPNYTNSEILEFIRASASQFNNPDNFLGFGIPNLDVALNKALSLPENPEKNDKTFTVYPNPVSNILNINSSALWNNGIIDIYDVLGRKIQMYKITPNLKVIDVSTLANGIYLLRASLKKDTQTFKFIKE